jgi:hypothetical protein
VAADLASFSFMTSHRLQLAGMILFLVVAASQAHASDETLLRAREGTAALLRGQYEKAVAGYDDALSNRRLQISSRPASTATEGSPNGG